MEDWLAALASASQRKFHEPDQPDFLSGYHHWYTTSHARPTYCNVCREALSGVTSHGLSCEVCKCKVHKRCAAKAINNCKWTTLASVGNEIIEDKDGNITMPHQWMEGNLPVSAKCVFCDKNCGSVLRLQDWRCLWCRSTVHTACRPLIPSACPLGPARVSVVPPTALHCIQDEAWDVVRPQASSPLLVFVNSKSGDNQGVKFLRRFKQLLNPAQVFDLISTGPRLGLRLFRHFNPFRILVCSGDGSVGWVLSEIDKLDMDKQCQVAVLPLGTGNDLARVLGWGSSCDDDTHLPQLLEKYERASTKMLDRWSIMTFERTIAMHKLSLTQAALDEQRPVQTISQYEDSVATHLQNILHSDETTVVLNSAKHLCEAVKDFVFQVSKTSLTQGDETFSSKCDVLNQKLDLLLQTLTQEELGALNIEIESNNDLLTVTKSSSPNGSSYDTLEITKDKDEKNVNNFKESRRARRKTMQKEALVSRANSLKRAIRNLVSHTEQVVDEQHFLQKMDTSNIERKNSKCMDTLKVLPTIDSGSSGEPSPCTTPSPNLSSSNSQTLISNRLISISPLPDIHRDSVCEESDTLLTLPVPPDFADSRRSSEIKHSTTNLADDLTKIIDQLPTTQIDYDKLSNNDDASTIMNLSTQTVIAAVTLDVDNKTQTEEQRIDNDQMIDSLDDNDKCNVMIKTQDEDNSSILSTISNEEISITSEIIEQVKSFCPRKDSDGEDMNGHIYHIDSPETSDTYPNSEALHGESLMEDVSSMLAQDIFIQMGGIDQDSIDTSYTDDTTLFSDIKKDLDIKNLKKKQLDEIEQQYGFENRAFMSQNVFINDDQTKLVEPIRYCSLAQFVEGNDIARRSFKRQRQKSVKVLKTEANVNRQSILTEESESNLDQMDNEGNLCARIFPQVSVIVEPPSPIISDQIRSERMIKLISDEQNLSTKSNSEYDLDEHSSRNSSNSNLLTIDAEQINFLKGSPAATRRISCGSLFKANEGATLAASMESGNCTISSSLSSKDNNTSDKKDKKDDERPFNKALPIINPLVRLPSWPYVGTGTGFIGQCLLANADTLCAAVSPLMDPDETLLEGFIERCVMNNYFGIGIDAKISLDFHNKREEHPEKCRSRAKNYMWYGVLGSKQWLQRTYKNLEQRVQLECDGRRIPLPSLQGIVVLNIPSFMGGTNFWGGSKEDDIFIAPSFDDRILEVVAVFGSVQMAASRLINLQHHRIAQCQSIQINILGDEGVPVQVDGEAWIQPPGMIRIIHKNRMQMLCRNRSLENSLKAWEEKQKQCLSTPGEKSRNSSLTLQRPSITLPRHSTGHLSVNITEKLRQHSFSGQTLTVPRAHHEKSHSITYIENILPPSDLKFNDEEHNLLLNFIECATTLAKWIKLLAISNPKMDIDLYTIAEKIDECLERIHPHGKLLEGDVLRIEFSKLYEHVKQLFEDSCLLLRDKGHNLKLRDDLETKLSITLANTEMELRKCVLVDTPKGNLVFLHQIHEEHSDRKHRKGLFWIKFRGKATMNPLSQNTGTAKDVATWGTQEVATWLETLQLSEYTESFIRNDIRGRELLTLARRDLKDLGVTKVGHVKRILQAVKDLNQK
ncbi:diacylglycerol kinase eta [Chrysoperla carnea]|uniref:diacylglycerol kinase eta n=1 Tax=Chrysoperla carnea TaxID=189513 RepID=UPI001D077939|nr:diacylglycerol kinase eta [Chrysoperla carnea]